MGRCYYVLLLENLEFSISQLNTKLTEVSTPKGADVSSNDPGYNETQYS